MVSHAQDDRSAYDARLEALRRRPLWTVMSDTVPHEPLPKCKPALALGTKVVEGRGTARVGDRTFAFAPHDILVTPSWTRSTFKADEDVVLFSFPNRGVPQKRALVREQMGNALERAA